MEVGELGVSLFDFYAMTWKEWNSYSEGLRKAKIRQWEHTRAINYMVYKVNADPKKPIKSITAFWSLPTDPKVKAKRTGKRVTKAQMKAYDESMR